MIIKVCGMRELENIRAVSRLDIDWMGFVFLKDSPRYVQQISSRAGTLPDYPSLQGKLIHEWPVRQHKVLRVGVFKDDMPQNIVTRVVNYLLDIVQLDGDESPVMMDNLRRTLDPDIHPNIKLMKTIRIGCTDDLKCCANYVGHADYFLFEPKQDVVGEEGFDWNWLTTYDVEIPFIIGGNIGMKDVERVRMFKHPMFHGINLDSCFEIGYAMKDTMLLKTFIEHVRKEGNQSSEATSK